MPTPSSPAFTPRSALRVTTMDSLLFSQVALRNITKIDALGKQSSASEADSKLGEAIYALASAQFKLEGLKSRVEINTLGLAKQKQVLQYSLNSNNALIAQNNRSISNLPTPLAGGGLADVANEDTDATKSSLLSKNTTLVSQNNKVQADIGLALHGIDRNNALVQQINVALFKVAMIRNTVVQKRKSLDLYRDAALGYVAASFWMGTSSRAVEQFVLHLADTDTGTAQLVAVSDYITSMKNINDGKTAEGMTATEVGVGLRSYIAYENDHAIWQRDMDNLNDERNYVENKGFEDSVFGDDFHDRIVNDPTFAMGDLDGDGIPNNLESSNNGDIDGDGLINGNDPNPFVNDNLYPNPSQTLSDIDQKIALAASSRPLPETYPGLSADIPRPLDPRDPLIYTQPAASNPSPGDAPMEGNSFVLSEHGIDGGLNRLNFDSYEIIDNGIDSPVDQKRAQEFLSSHDGITVTVENNRIVLTSNAGDVLKTNLEAHPDIAHENDFHYYDRIGNNK